MRSGYFKTNPQGDRELFPFFIDKLAFALLMLIIVVFPFLSSGSWLNYATMMGIVTIGAIGLNIIMGYTGQISLGHASFIAIGAYVTAISSKFIGFLPAPLVIVFAGFVAGAFGLIIAIPSFRLKGLYLAVSTLAFYYITIFLIVKAGFLTNGAIGLPISKPNFIWFSIESLEGIYGLAWTIAGVSILCTVNLVRTKAGRAFIAIRDRDIAAEVMGISINKWKTYSFFLGSFFAGVGGAVYGYYVSFICPEDFPFHMSIVYLSAVLIGGMGSIIGPILGSFFVIIIPELSTKASSIISDYYNPFAGGVIRSYLEMILFGAFIMFFVIFESDGLYGRWKTIRNYFIYWPFRY